MARVNHIAFRIIDANLNRAREALRVMEEYTRFGLDDAGLTAALKETRHELRGCADDFEARCGGQTSRTVRGDEPAHSDGRGSDGQFARTEARGSVVGHREIVGDVGREVGTESEYRRADAADVALAAGKRLSEALRAIEEYGKVIDPTFAAGIERIRYRGYELERRLTLTATARNRFGHARLYVIVTESLCKGDWFKAAEAALCGGADCLQLREKALADGELLGRAARLADLCRKRGVLFIVNDRPDVAVAVGADGVHLGQDDLTVVAARRILPSTALVGLSTHTVEQVAAAAEQAPDYIAVGPMFATATKPQEHVAGPATLAAARALTSLPLVAVGGINAQNALEVLAGDPCCICVCSAVIAQADVEAAAARLRTLIAGSADGPL